MAALFTEHRWAGKPHWVTADGALNSVLLRPCLRPLNCVLINFQGVKMSKKTPALVLDVNRTLTRLTFPWLLPAIWLAEFLRTLSIFGIYLKAHTYLTQNTNLPQPAFHLQRKKGRSSSWLSLGFWPNVSGLRTAHPKSLQRKLPQPCGMTVLP